MCERCVFTVPRLMKRRAPICGLVRPSATRRTTSSSVGVRLDQPVAGRPRRPRAAAGVFDALVEGEPRALGGRPVERGRPERSPEVGGGAVVGPLLVGPARQAGLRAGRPGRIQDAHVVGRRLDGRTDAGKCFKAVGLGGAQPMVDADGQRRVVEFDGAGEPVRFGGGEFGLCGVRLRQGTGQFAGVERPQRPGRAPPPPRRHGRRRRAPHRAGAGPGRRARSRRPGRWSGRPAAARSTAACGSSRRIDSTAMAWSRPGTNTSSSTPSTRRSTGSITSAAPARSPVSALI